MIEEYLKIANKDTTNYYEFHKWSGLSFLEASSIWIKNLNIIKEFKNETKT